MIISVQQHTPIFDLVAVEASSPLLSIGRFFNPDREPE